MTDGRVLVYGSYGYTGDLVVRRAVMRGLDPVVAGRRGGKVNRQADDLGLEARVFALDDPGTVADHLRGIDAVLHCAGPFVDTHDPMVRACVETGTHYLDITGEIEVFESIHDRDERARDAGVMLLPGVGFDVVPTDCLAVHLHERLPSATDLSLAFTGLSSMSKGTAKTSLDQLDATVVREDGELQRVPYGVRNRRIDFGDGSRTATSIPWGDVATAAYSTGIGNVTVYATVPRLALPAMRAGSLFAPFLTADPVKRPLRAVLDATVSGPDERTRRESTVRLWGEATDGDERVTARMTTPEPYEFTVRSTLAAVERVLEGSPPVGYRTPGDAFGPDFVLEIDGVERDPSP